MSRCSKRRTQVVVAVAGEEDWNLAFASHTRQRGETTHEEILCLFTRHVVFSVQLIHRRHHDERERLTVGDDIRDDPGEAIQQGGVLICGEPTSSGNPVEIPWVGGESSERPCPNVSTRIDPHYLTGRFEELIENDGT